MHAPMIYSVKFNNQNKHLKVVEKPYYYLIMYFVKISLIWRLAMDS